MMLLLWTALLACVGGEVAQVPGPTAPDGDPRAAMAAQPLVYTRHARCRMGCREVSEAEVVALLREGRWVPERTRLDGECPSHALEGRSADGQELRVVYAACAGETRVVTAIDLGEDHPCSCE